jgi:aryl-alcohol dehydrogenase-like predicted oxidoreductase
MDRMQYRPLGQTGLRIPAVGFGAGPIAGLMTGADAKRQAATLRRAVESGIDWFDTAATYGDGQSERALGQALRQAGSAGRVQVATKIRLQADDLADMPGAIRSSVEGSLDRLGLPRLVLLQLHNSITRLRGELPTSLAPADVLGPRGVLETFRALRDEGIVQCVGCTALGQLPALKEVLSCGEFVTAQVEYSLANPTAGHAAPTAWPEANYGRLLDLLVAHRIAPLAIRILAGGALAGREPSPYTYRTKFFPLDLFERDRARAARLTAVLPPGLSLREAALRFALGDPRVATALVGLGTPDEVDQAAACVEAGPLPAGLVSRLVETCFAP